VRISGKVQLYHYSTGKSIYEKRNLIIGNSLPVSGIIKNGFKYAFRKLTIYLYGSARYVSKQVGDRRICRVPAHGNFHQAVQQCELCGVEYYPLTRKISFKAGMKILWLQLVSINGTIAGRDGEGLSSS